MKGFSRWVISPPDEIHTDFLENPAKSFGFPRRLQNVPNDNKNNKNKNINISINMY